jgi:ABC-type multidrug transport system fused ATPase/permease subunit
MQRVIKEEFTDCTNITIAHRLESVIGFDKVLVLDAGRILEFDTPRKLLETTESRFYELCEATGNLDELKEKVK